MAGRESVSPSTLRLEATDRGLEVRYLDGRRTVYRRDPAPSTPPLRTKPGRIVQVLLADEALTEGVLVFVNDPDTEAEILEESGVGRVNLDPDDHVSVLPGVTVEMDGYSAVVDVDFAAVDARVFCFEEGQLGADAHELVPRGAE
ncbi:MAG: DUF5796 family protein [Halobacteriales archaeon]